MVTCKKGLSRDQGGQIDFWAKSGQIWQFSFGFPLKSFQKSPQVQSNPLLKHQTMGFCTSPYATVDRLTGNIQTCFHVTCCRCCMLAPDCMRCNFFACMRRLVASFDYLIIWQRIFRRALAQTKHYKSRLSHGPLIRDLSYSGVFCGPAAQGGILDSLYVKALRQLAIAPVW